MMNRKMMTGEDIDALIDMLVMLTRLGIRLYEDEFP
jgi:hypothetical protein